MTDIDQWMKDRGYRSVIQPVGGYDEGFDPTREYQFMRKDWIAPSVFRLCDRDPEFNVAGLFYRPERGRHERT